MKYNYRHYGRALYEALVDGRDDEKVIVERFAKMIFEKGLIKRLPDIIRAFESVIREQQGQKLVTMTVANKDHVTKALIDEVSGLLPSGFEYQVLVNEDAELLGGMTLRVDDTLIDASVKTSLLSLYDRMVS